MAEAAAVVLEGDPVLGRVVADYLSNRARRLIIAGVIFAGAALLLTLLLWELDDETAAAITIPVLGVVGLIVGWYVLHIWNREVVLYERGFSYREGSNVVYLLYDEVRSIRQRAEQLSYAGILRRNVYTVTIKTIRDETIVLDSTYRKIDELGPRLEALINRTLHPIIAARLANGERVEFGKLLTMTAVMLHSENLLGTDNVPDLLWSDYGGYKIENRQLHILKKPDDTLWLPIPIAEIDNVMLLLDILKDKPTS